MIRKIITIGCFLLVTLFAAQTYAIDLTGTWHIGTANYYVRQIGTEVWWFGESASVTPFYSNVAHGFTDGFAVMLNWADVPKGGTTSDGTLLLVISSNNLMIQVYSTGGFGYYGMPITR